MDYSLCEVPVPSLCLNFIPAVRPRPCISREKKTSLIQHLWNELLWSDCTPFVTFTCKTFDWVETSYGKCQMVADTHTPTSIFLHDLVCVQACTIAVCGAHLLVGSISLSLLSLSITNTHTHAEPISWMRQFFFALHLHFLWWAHGFNSHNIRWYWMFHIKSNWRNLLPHSPQRLCNFDFYAPDSLFYICTYRFIQLYMKVFLSVYMYACILICQ